MATELFHLTIQAELGLAYISINYKSKKRLKILITCEKQVINYDATTEMIIPLTFGNGTYKFTLCENTANNSYKRLSTKSRAIKMKDIDAYMLQPNSYVKYDELSSFYTTAKNLKTWSAVKNYITNKFSYDYVTAVLKARKTFEPSDLEAVFKTRKGICGDLAAITVAFARICGIPARMVFGTANKNNHAWVEANGEIFDPTYAVQRKKSPLTYIPLRYY